MFRQASVKSCDLWLFLELFDPLKLGILAEALVLRVGLLYLDTAPGQSEKIRSSIHNPRSIVPGITSLGGPVRVAFGCRWQGGK